MSEFGIPDLTDWTLCGDGIMPWWRNLQIIQQISESRGYPVLFEGPISLEIARKHLDRFALTMGEVHVTYTDGEGNRQVVKDEATHAVVLLAKGMPTYYASHDQWMQHGEVLLPAVEPLIGDGVGIQTLGVLDHGATAYLSLALPDDVKDEMTGLTFRNRLNVARGVNGQLSNSAFLSDQIALCDNTFQIAYEEGASSLVTVKNSKAFSLDRFTSSMEVAGFLGKRAEAAQAFFRDLANTEVTDSQWRAFVAAQYGPEPVATSSKHAVTRWHNLTDLLDYTYRRDFRCADWTGTALGVFQTDNTYRQHLAIRRGAGEDATDSQKNAQRAVRNLTDTLSGQVGKDDLSAVATLRKVLATV